MLGKVIAALNKVWLRSEEKGGRCVGPCVFCEWRAVIGM